jgi:hypothetical protein
VFDNSTYRIYRRTFLAERFKFESGD